MEAAAVGRTYHELVKKRFCFKIVDWYHYKVYFSKAVACISGLICSHSFVSDAVVSLLMTYLGSTGSTLAVSAITVSIQQGLSVIFALAMAHMSDAWIGRFRVIIYATPPSIIGLMILCFFSPSWGSPLLYLALLLLLVGEASANPLKAFLADQLKEDILSVGGRADEDKVNARTRFWLFWCGGIGTWISGPMHYWLPWKYIFLTAATMMGVAYLPLWYGFRPGFYHDNEPTVSPLSPVYRVLKAALLNIRLQYPSEPTGYYKNDGGQLMLSHFRLLNKAAIVHSSSVEIQEEQERIGKLCLAADVEKVKRLIELFPMWTSFLVYGLVVAAGSTFFVEQIGANNVNTYGTGNGAIVYLLMFKNVSNFIVSFIADRLILKRYGDMKYRANMVRIGTGMAFAVLCCFIAWQVELYRLNLVDRSSSDTIITMKVFWLVPQFFCLGAMDGLAVDGLRDFFMDHVDESMTFYESPFNKCVLGIGKFLNAIIMLLFRGWFGETINESRLDEYFFYLALLTSTNLSFYALGVKYAWPDNSAESSDLEVGSTLRIPFRNKKSSLRMRSIPIVSALRMRSIGRIRKESDSRI